MTVRDDGPVRHLTINRPEARNALNAGVFDALEAALDDVAAGGVRVLVLAGPQAAGLAHETAPAALATSSPDAAEGIAAFLDKRDPAFAEPAS